MPCRQAPTFDTRTDRKASEVIETANQTPMSPLLRLVQWVQEERSNGVDFPNGAVLGTVASGGQPRTRMLGVHFDAHGTPRFHTAPGSRKVQDLRQNNQASLTFAFQRSLRSVSLEGEVEVLTPTELGADWRMLDSAFRRSYLVFGAASGQPLDSPSALVQARQALEADAEQHVPASFIGFRFYQVRRIAFYCVGDGDFAAHVSYAFDSRSETWSAQMRVP